MKRKKNSFFKNKGIRFAISFFIFAVLSVFFMIAIKPTYFGIFVGMITILIGAYVTALVSS